MWIPYLVGNIKIKLFFQGPLAKWDSWIRISHLKFNSEFTPEKVPDPRRKPDCLPSVIFQGRFVKLWECMESIASYCWWKKSCTTWGGIKPCKLWDKLPTSTGETAGFLPSTVWIPFFDQMSSSEIFTQSRSLRLNARRINVVRNLSYNWWVNWPQSCRIDLCFPHDSWLLDCGCPVGSVWHWLCHTTPVPMLTWIDDRQILEVIVTSKRGWLRMNN